MTFLSFQTRNHDRNVTDYRVSAQVEGGDEGAEEADLVGGLVGVGAAQTLGPASQTSPIERSPSARRDTGSTIRSAIPGSGAPQLAIGIAASPVVSAGRTRLRRSSAASQVRVRRP